MSRLVLVQGAKPVAFDVVGEEATFHLSTEPAEGDVHPPLAAGSTRVAVVSLAR